jgi:hypothetical protein
MSFPFLNTGLGKIRCAASGSELLGFVGLFTPKLLLFNVV